MYPQVNLHQILSHIPWFADLTQAQLQQMASIASLHRLDSGDIVFNEGDREDSLYVILEGQVARKEDLGGDHHLVPATELAHELPGQLFRHPRRIHVGLDDRLQGFE